MFKTVFYVPLLQEWFIWSFILRCSCPNHHRGTNTLEQLQNSYEPE